MARIKSNVDAPAQPIASPAPSAIDNWLAGLDMAAVTDKCGAAYRAGMSRGYDDQLAASEACAVTYDVLAAWNPRTTRIDNDAAENAIRDLHLRAEPQSSTFAVLQSKELLGHLSTACEEETVAHVRGSKAEGGLGRNILPVRAKDKSQADGRDELQKIKVEAKKKGDVARVAAAELHLKAVGNLDKVVDICKDAALLEAANSRFRRRIYLRLVAPMMDAAKVAHAEYERVCGAAKQAHEACGKLSAQDRTVTRVKSTIEAGVTKFIAENFGTQVKEQRPNAEIGKAAALAVLVNVRKACKYGEVPENVRDEVVAWIVNGAGIVDPEAPKEPKPPKGKKAAEAKSTKARQKKVKAPKTAPTTKRRVRATPPPAVVSTTTEADDILEDLAS